MFSRFVSIIGELRNKESRFGQHVISGEATNVKDSMHGEELAAQNIAHALDTHASAVDSPKGEQQTLIERLLAAHRSFFDVETDYEFEGSRFDGYAEFHSHGEKYVLTKSAKLWEVDAAEYVFFKSVGDLTESLLQELLEFMKTNAVKKVKPEPNHMTSYISLVIVASSVSRDVAKRVKKTSYHKTYMFGLRGWAELRLCVVDMDTRSVITNAQGREMKAVLEENAGFATTGKRGKRR